MQSYLISKLLFKSLISNWLSKLSGKLWSEGEHPVFASWNAAETQKKKFDQKFDFEERGYFGTKRKEASEKNKFRVSWNVAETQLKRSWNAAETRFAPEKITLFSKAGVNIGCSWGAPNTHHLTNRFRRPRNLAETGCSPSVRAHLHTPRPWASRWYPGVGCSRPQWWPGVGSCPHLPLGITVCTKYTCFCYKSTVRGTLWLRSDVSFIPCFLSHNSWMRKKVLWKCSPFVHKFSRLWKSFFVCCLCCVKPRSSGL